MKTLGGRFYLFAFRSGPLRFQTIRRWIGRSIGRGFGSIAQVMNGRLWLVLHCSLNCFHLYKIDAAWCLSCIQTPPLRYQECMYILYFTYAHVQGLPYLTLHYMAGVRYSTYMRPQTMNVKIKQYLYTLFCGSTGSFQLAGWEKWLLRIPLGPIQKYVDSTLG